MKPTFGGLGEWPGGAAFKPSEPRVLVQFFCPQLNEHPIGAAAQNKNIREGAPSRTLRRVAAREGPGPTRGDVGPGGLPEEVLAI